MTILIDLRPYHRFCIYFLTEQHLVEAERAAANLRLRSVVDYVVDDVDLTVVELHPAGVAEVGSPAAVEVYRENPRQLLAAHCLCRAVARHDRAEHILRRAAPALQEAMGDEDIAVFKQTGLRTVAAGQGNIIHALPARAVVI